MGRLGDGTVRLALPLEKDLAPLVLGPVRSFFRLSRLPRSATVFILSGISGALKRIAGRRGGPPPRVRLTLKDRSGTTSVTLRISGARSPDLRLASLVRKGPPSVEGEYRPGPGGGTLLFRFRPKGKA